MKIKIIADSSANLLTLDGADFASVPLKIQAGEKEYLDNAQLNVSGMVAELGAYRGKSSTACPSVGQWLEAFGDADWVFGTAITSHLSGCYASGMMAAEEYMEQHPGRRVFLLDSLSTGPEMELILERYVQLIAGGLSFESICEKIREYKKRTHLFFSLESLQNFVNNGRVKPAVAAAAKLLGICIVGKASDQGDLQPLHKCRGGNRALRQILQCMQDVGFRGGKVRITHSANPGAASTMESEIRKLFPDCDIRIRENRGLCSYYAEKGGVLVGFESV